MRIEVLYDTAANVPIQIETYLHCTKCLEELPEGVSPSEWARTQMGVTADGHIQVICSRHQMNVALLTIQAVEKPTPGQRIACGHPSHAAPDPESNVH